MRIAVLILGLVLAAALLIQTHLVHGLSGVVRGDLSSLPSLGGLLMATLWVVAAAFVWAFPTVSNVSFVAAALIGLGVSRELGTFLDLAFWAVVSLGLAVLSHGSSLEKDREEDEE